ncbi:MAG: outer membrane beta-barrel protein [Bacteroidales bacterium]|nr:outer membrane beta-barrel protein [Bacteroidales bacterium]
MKMTFFLSVVILFSSLFVNAQNKREQEIGIKFTSFNGNFGVMYKIGNKNNHFRVSAMRIGISENNENREFYKNETKKMSSLGLTLGYERIIPIKDKLNFYTGPFISSSYYLYENLPKDQTEFNSKERRLGLGAGLILGTRVNINNHFSISAEITPEYYYNDSKQTNEDPQLSTEEQITSSTSKGFNFNTSTVNFCLAYRF